MLKFIYLVVSTLKSSWFFIDLGPNHRSEEQIALARIIRNVRFDISKQSTCTISYTVYICIDMWDYVRDTSTCCSDRVLSCFSCVASSHRGCKFRWYNSCEGHSEDSNLGGAYELVAASQEIKFLGSEIHPGSVFDFHGDTTRRDTTGDRASPSYLSDAWKVLLIRQHFGLACERDREEEVSCKAVSEISFQSKTNNIITWEKNKGMRIFVWHRYAQIRWPRQRSAPLM